MEVMLMRSLLSRDDALGHHVISVEFLQNARNLLLDSSRYVLYLESIHPLTIWTTGLVWVTGVFLGDWSCLSDRPCCSEQACKKSTKEASFYCNQGHHVQSLRTRCLEDWVGGSEVLHRPAVGLISSRLDI